MGSQAPTFRANVRTREKALSGRLYPEILSPFRTGWPGAIRRVGYARLLAQTAVFAYLFGFAIDWNLNILLVFLAVSSIAAAILGEERFSWRSPIVVLVAIFWSVTALSIGISEDVPRSLRLSAPLLPAVLLFLLIYEHFNEARDLRRLFMWLAVVALGLALTLLWTALGAPGGHPRNWVREVGSPILIVPNDVTFLAITAPLALALVHDRARGVVKTMAVLSIAMSACVAAVYGSRTATVAFLGSSLCTAAVLQSRRSLLALAIGFLCVVTLYSFLDLPLLSKLSRIGLESNGRLRLWTFAWAMFMDAPLLGQGLHTFIDDNGIPWAHSLYLQTLAEQGVVGLLALLLLLSYAMLAAWKATRSPIRERRVLAAGALGALVGFGAASAVELTLLREWVVLVMFVFLAVVARIPSAAALSVED